MKCLLCMLSTAPVCSSTWNLRAVWLKADRPATSAAATFSGSTVRREGGRVAARKSKTDRYSSAELSPVNWYIPSEDSSLISCNK